MNACPWRELEVFCYSRLLCWLVQWLLKRFLEFVIRRNAFITKNHFRLLIGKDTEYSYWVLPLQVCSLWRRSHAYNICRAWVGATKTLGLAVMEWKWNIFLNDTKDQLLHRGWRGLCVTRKTKAKMYLTDKKKDIRDSWISEKVRLKAAESEFC